MSTLHGFNISKPNATIDWSDTVISNEGFKDTLTDLFTSKLKEEDINKTKSDLELLKQVSNTKLNYDTPLVIINEKKSVLQFYTKKGRVIFSFSDELTNQVKSIEILTKSIKVLSDQISKLDIKANEYEALEELNDSVLMPIFNSVSKLSFLDSIYIRHVANKSIDKLQLNYDKDYKKLTFEKKSAILAFLSGSLAGGISKSVIPLAATNTGLKVLKLPIHFKIVSNLGVIAFYSFQSISQGIKAYKLVKSHNKRADDVFFDIVDAAQIEPSDFETKSKALYKASNELFTVIESFYRLDQQYKESDTKLIRDMLRNTRILSVVGLKVIESQSNFFNNLIKKNV